jgi:cellulose synthase/poly-beta-1,6-N-acetylglucosamine synthase-like glycosyltransferase
MSGPPDGQLRNPLVSVVIDNYNYAPYLGEAIDSALDQTYPRVEVIVVDDGSTDDSPAVLDSYGDRIKSFRQANGGQASAMNFGLAQARGEVFIMLDSDDTLAPDVVERAVRVLTADPRCVRVQWRLDTVRLDGTPLGRRNPPDGVPLMTGDLSGYVAQRHLFRSPPASGNAFRTAALQALPPVPEDVFRQYVDRWYSELSSLLGTVAALDAPGGTYRVHESSHSRGLGWGADYFTTRIQLTEMLHATGRRMMLDRGVPDAGGYAPTAEQSPDAAYLGWRIAMHKLSDEPIETAFSLGRLLRRALQVTATQPGLSLKTRAGRLAWLVGLTVAPRGSAIAQRMVATRYEREG